VEKVITHFQKKRHSNTIYKRKEIHDCCGQRQQEYLEIWVIWQIRGQSMTHVKGKYNSKENSLLNTSTIHYTYNTLKQ
jgi:hypothetical protein